MAFVDIKCLESLLIEGEELSIANEELGSAIGGFLKTIINNIGNFFKVILNNLTSLLAKLKSKKS